ncbi:hypothetical protein SKAU_G00192390 [Synaphobranchus kaupii]|uniref:Gypsy retrotransposon integrase-like protein 1 n=1 Tax=Synaphobranchus kaupii TaxID=118154 RepID=A0A9Q1FDN9_SYNKA|nr:hypothetical protein SKAU_G00192390 [Synaphobranchus kaupii]
MDRVQKDERRRVRKPAPERVAATCGAPILDDRQSTLFSLCSLYSLPSKVLQVVYGTPGVGHFGVNKTLNRLQAAVILGLVRWDVETHCCHCDTCTAKKGTGVTEWGIHYVLITIDYFTKWPEAYGIPTQEASVVAECLFSGMFSRFGVQVLELHSDQGRNVKSLVFTQVACCRIQVHDDLDHVHQLAQEHLASTARQKRKYGLCYTSRSYWPGDEVWVYNSHWRNGVPVLHQLQPTVTAPQFQSAGDSQSAVIAPQFRSTAPAPHLQSVVTPQFQSVSTST